MNDTSNTNDFIRRFSEMEKTINDLSRAQQIVYAQWIDIPDSKTFGTNQFYFSNSNVLPSKYFKVGTKLKYKKNGVTVYGYVGWVSSNNKIRVYSNSTGRFTALDTISDMQYSLIEPLDFPSFFVETSVTPQASGGGQIITGTMTYNWYMKGDLITVETADVGNLIFTGSFYNIFYINTIFDASENNGATNFDQNDSAAGYKMGTINISNTGAISLGNYLGLYFMFDFINGGNNWQGLSDVYYATLTFRQTSFPYTL